MGGNLDLLFDESGDLGKYQHSQSKLFILTVVIATSPQLINRERLLLEHTLTQLGHSEMLHTAPLVRGTNPYKNLSLKMRHTILNQFVYFSLHSKMLVHSIIIDRADYPSTTSLISKLSSELNNFFTKFHSLLTNYSTATLNYDNGQPRITKLLTKILQTHPTFRLRSNFDNETNRTFQIADLYTYLDKLHYKLNHNIPLTTSERRFFSQSDLKFIQNACTQTRLYK